MSYCGGENPPYVLENKESRLEAVNDSGEMGEQTPSWICDGCPPASGAEGLAGRAPGKQATLPRLQIGGRQNL